MMNISIRWWFVGGLVDCTTKTSSPRTFSSIFTKVSPSGKELTVDFPSSTPMDAAMERASGRLAVPLKIFTVSMTSFAKNNNPPPGGFEKKRRAL
jgi:hypothetical protein